jgi:hypothetical protein
MRLRSKSARVRAICADAGPGESLRRAKSPESGNTYPGAILPGPWKFAVSSQIFFGGNTGPPSAATLHDTFKEHGGPIFLEVRPEPSKGIESENGNRSPSAVIALLGCSPKTDLVQF